MIGLSAALLMLLHGRIAGISGILARLLPPTEDGETSHRLFFLAGLVLAPLFYSLLMAKPLTPQIPPLSLFTLVAGLLVGFGAVYGNGCTSGHGVCGLSRLSVRSLIATMVFMGTAILTLFILRQTGSL